MRAPGRQFGQGLTREGAGAPRRLEAAVFQFRPQLSSRRRAGVVVGSHRPGPECALPVRGEPRSQMRIADSGWKRTVSHDPAHRRGIFMTFSQNCLRQLLHCLCLLRCVKGKEGRFCVPPSIGPATAHMMGEHNNQRGLSRGHAASSPFFSLARLLHLLYLSLTRLRSAVSASSRFFSASSFCSDGHTAHGPGTACDGLEAL